MLTNNLIHIFHNIPTVVGITCKGGSLGCKSCMQLVVINIKVYTNLAVVEVVKVKERSGSRVWLK